MSPTRTATLTAASAITCIVVMVHILEAASHERLVPGPIATLLVSAAIVTWSGHLCAFVGEKATTVLACHVDRRCAELLAALRPGEDTRAVDTLLNAAYRNPGAPANGHGRPHIVKP